MDKKNSAAAVTAPQKFKWSPVFSNSYVIICGIALLVVIVFTPFLFSDKMLFGSDTMNGLDSHVFLKNSLGKYHQFPMWFNSRLGGMPSIDAMFGDAMYPPTLAINAVQPIPRALGLRLVFHVFLAGLFFFLLLRKGFNMPAYIAGIGAAFYMLNPEFFSHVYPGHDGKMFVIAWLPFLIWRMKALMDRPSFLNSTLMALGIAACLFTSHLQMSYLMLWGCFFYWVIAMIVAWRREKKVLPLVKIGCYFWMAVAIGMGLAFIQLLPPFMYVREAFSVRGVDRGFEYAASWSLHWPEAFSMWVPDFGNTLDFYWSENAFKLNSEYAGAMALLFGVIAVVQKPKNLWRIFWAAFALFALLYAMGVHTPVFYLMYYLVPGVKKFRASSMFMFWFSFSAILLASLFFKDVAAGWFNGFSEERKKKWVKGLLIALGSITVLTLLFSIKGFVTAVMQPLTTALADTQKIRVFDANFSKNFVPFLWLWWFFAGASLLLLMGVVSNKVGKYAFLTAVLAFGLIDITRVDAKFIKTINPKPYFYAEQAITDLQAEMAREPFRCFTLPGALPQGGEGIHGLEGVGGFHDNELCWYRQFRGDQQDRNYFTNLIGVMQDGRPYLKPDNLKDGNAFLNIANAKYYLVRQNDELFKIPNEGALPRISFAPGYVVMDSAAVVGALKTGAYDYRHKVCLLQEPEVKPAPSADSLASTPASVKWVAYTPNYRKAEVAAGVDGFLRISEVYYPGWKIRIDGTPVKIYRSDLAWMAVNFPKGSHTVEMIPQSLYLGKAEMVSYPMMILLGMYWIGLGVVRFAKRKK
ncbi:MAG TPA: hypothetical protein VLX68_06785 [Chitinivibrionales bacterium]|nr:hypothetical protein [Chitinivibrionales bacterium]